MLPRLLLLVLALTLVVPLATPSATAGASGGATTVGSSRGAGRDDPAVTSRASVDADLRSDPVPGVHRPPLAGPLSVLAPFDPPEHRYRPGHRGVDLGAPVAATVRASAAGRVVYAAPLAGRGVVSVEHASGLRTTYEPVTAAVRRGDRVDAGTVLGALEAGHARCAPATCLHWGARLPDGSYVDPMLLLAPPEVRLEPWDP
ncbi:M23 family metallopeptidase [Nakamurella alba]|uniref:M23 family metallopeptidase n=1 Tax=Nakamurella alba TaxID=2665158 RepID=UPI002AC34A61|nr:M23 family metallopeptidase [Nakamurella alba]